MPEQTDPRGFIPPHPTAEQARHVNDAIRSDDFYPCQVGIFCDRCGDTIEADYLVGADDDQAARFEIARAHLRTLGWKCTPGADLCPACLPVSCYVTSLVARDSDGTVFEVLGLGDEPHDGRGDMVCLGKVGALGYSRVHQATLVQDFTAYPAPASPSTPEGDHTP